ncbi:LysR substrate-binding domain-containing protein [Pseudomonas sp. 6D_7.1_Bac1]|uniref:LysR substrate-binding domain-containing protein n=1 Tax=Pseudomonas sp. 6D_7.1_Bac1 TaxID=2971615 RepID=UPI0021C5744A|nr:LysR substrate-binding domain-containing protein [Pseudomonas sp. 6D_7.1_Bac1]MCU1751818.1 LysR substrate-binding domain-containing protein [Pseudomonas sp. 6D_7.1_Bac1]
MLDVVQDISLFQVVFCSTSPHMRLNPGQDTQRKISFANDYPRYCASLFEMSASRDGSSMQLKSLRIFLAVAETGSFVAAAERLHTVQSNVTAHIKKLETELGAQLIDRNGRVRLTSAGHALSEYADRIQRNHDEAVAFFRGNQSLSGELRIGAMETTTAFRLPGILASFHGNHPEVDIKLTTGPTADLVRGLVEGRFDCVFVAGKVDHRRYHMYKAFTEELVLISSRPLEKMPPKETLLTATFLAFRQGCSYRHSIELLLASCGVSAVRIIDFGTLDAMLGCVAAGMGYAVLPKSAVEAQRSRFNIYSLDLPERYAIVDTYFAAAPQNTWTPAMASFSETVCDALVITDAPPSHEVIRSQKV